MVYAAQGVAAVAPSVADATTKDGVGYKAWPQLGLTSNHICSICAWTWLRI
jgi:hypothetical protein